MVPFQTAKHYRDRAEECRRLAGLASTAKAREEYEHIAGCYDQLAEAEIALAGSRRPDLSVSIDEAIAAVEHYEPRILVACLSMADRAAASRELIAQSRALLAKVDDLLAKRRRPPASGYTK